MMTENRFSDLPVWEVFTNGEKESKAWLDLRENRRRIRENSGDSSEEFFGKGKLLLGKRGRLKPLKKKKVCVFSPDYCPGGKQEL